MATAYPNIRKQDGSLEPFDPQKLRSSLRRSGADASLSDAIVSHIEDEIQEGDTTSTIYRHAFSLLKKKSARLPAARYSMKRAVRELGPSGFPFEDFIAEIFKAKGYRTKTGVIIKGTCAAHEVDLVAEKNGKRVGAEIKFHNSLSINSDLKVALYVDARFRDLQESGIEEGWLITNTRFTQNAVEYGKCRNLTMISWSYPHKGCLQDLIEETGVQPITALTRLSNHEKRLLLDRGVVLCKTLNNAPAMLDAGISPHRRDAIMEESWSLCGSAKGV